MNKSTTTIPLSHAAKNDMTNSYAAEHIARLHRFPIDVEGLDRRILVVDDERDIRTMISGVLQDEGYNTIEAATSQEVRYIFEKSQTVPQLVVLDVLLKGSQHNGIEILEWLREGFPQTQVIIISGHGTIDLAVKATKIGASTFLTKPFSSQVLMFSIAKALKETRLRKENEHLRWLTGQDATMFPGVSAVARQVRETITKVASSDSRILLQGEAGSGKLVVAANIHYASQYADGPMIHIRCAGKSAQQILPELFGREREGFLSDHSPKAGAFGAALGGTIVLEDVDMMDHHTQVAMVNALAHTSLNNKNDIRHKVRIISSTRKNLAELCEKKLYLSELFARLAVVVISIPTLKNRLVDIPHLAVLSMARASAITSRPPRVITNDAIIALQHHHWKGNIRELDGFIHKLMMTNDVRTESVSAQEIADNISHQQKTIDNSNEDVSLEAILQQPLKNARTMFERIYLQHHINLTDGNISAAAQRIGMNRAALHRKLRDIMVKIDDENSTSKEEYDQ